MDLQSIFLLSIASKRMNNLIVSVEKARFTKIKYILMNIAHSMRIEAVSYDGSSEVIIEIYCKTTLVKCLGTLSIFGTKVEFGKLPSPRPQDLVLIYNNYLTNNPDRVFSRTILESIQNYSYSLFGNDKEYQVNVCMYEEFKLPNLKNVNSSYIWKFPTIEGKTLDDFCSLSPNQEFLFVGPEVKGQLDDSSVIYGYKTIQIEEKDAMIVPSILRKFRGNQAFLWTSKIENSDIVQFLKRWMLNDGFDNLEVLTIDSKLNSQLFDPTEIRNSIGFSESNTAITPPIFYFKRRQMIQFLPIDSLIHSKMAMGSFPQKMLDSQLAQNTSPLLSYLHLACHSEVSDEGSLLQLYDGALSESVTIESNKFTENVPLNLDFGVRFINRDTCLMMISNQVTDILEFNNQSDTTKYHLFSTSKQNSFR
ncbi:hypothetical protein GCK72_000619 [Caenorhabditis remanei]|uniref:F-box associated domain-containing protein n=1 Tax=Caenorhabditis remanei TaxID=31234 RepID=A0A6A5HQ56_CAERE|nr:hypothetical protein GCK72_000619 [Caenorhabditis remanei]KAF1768806.1 hypothetical protein GCK72_000619 [Caenorhabditis remanei]